MKLKVKLGDSGEGGLADIKIIPPTRAANIIRISILLISKELPYSINIFISSGCPWSSTDIGSSVLEGMESLKFVDDVPKTISAGRLLIRPLGLE